MIRQEIHHALYQFKRIHKNQIAPKDPLLPQDIQDAIKRRNLNAMSNRELIQLLNKIINTITLYQKNRHSPHSGVEAFKQTLCEFILNKPL